MATRPNGVPPQDLDDEQLRRELRHLHETRHDTVLGGSESALHTHTERMQALEHEFLTRFRGKNPSGWPARTRAGSRERAGQSGT